MKAYNKKTLLYDNNINNKFNNNIKLTEPNNENVNNTDSNDDIKNNRSKDASDKCSYLNKMSVYRNKKIKDLNSNNVRNKNNLKNSILEDDTKNRRFK